MKLTRKDGSTYDDALTFTLLVDPEDQIISAVCVGREISEQKRLESQKLAFVANASHELRTPLTNLQTRLYLLAKQPEQFSQHLAALHKIGSRMQQLVEDLLDVSRFERGIIPISLQEITLQDLLHEAVQTQSLEAQQKTISLDYQAPQLPAYVLADRDRLMQVNHYLLTNAINYTPVGGNISVTLEIDENRDAIIRVQDSGMGIAVENLERVFDPFFRASERVGRGTGLGLSISKAIVELHGDSLTVESTINKGSTFTIRLALSCVNA